MRWNLRARLRLLPTADGWKLRCGGRYPFDFGLLYEGRSVWNDGQVLLEDPVSTTSMTADTELGITIELLDPTMVLPQLRCGDSFKLMDWNPRTRRVEAVALGTVIDLATLADLPT